MGRKKRTSRLNWDPSNTGELGPFSYCTSGDWKSGILQARFGLPGERPADHSDVLSAQCEDRIISVFAL